MATHSVLVKGLLPRMGMPGNVVTVVINIRTTERLPSQAHRAAIGEALPLRRYATAIPSAPARASRRPTATRGSAAIAAINIQTIRWS